MKRAILFFFILGLFFGTEAFSYQTHSNNASSYKPLGKIQRVRMAQHLVSKLMDQPFFCESELPSRAALSKLAVRGEAVPITATQFTNDVLNELLQQTHVVIVNQDFDTKIDSDYRLINYLTDYETRQKGVLLGADYYLQGGLEYTLIQNEKGKTQPSYRAELTVRNIRTDALITQAVYEFRAKSLRNH